MQPHRNKHTQLKKRTKPFIGEQCDSFIHMGLKDEANVSTPNNVSFCIMYFVAHHQRRAQYQCALKTTGKNALELLEEW